MFASAKLQCICTYNIVFASAKLQCICTDNMVQLSVAQCECVLLSLTCRAAMHTKQLSLPSGSGEEEENNAKQNYTREKIVHCKLNTH